MENVEVRVELGPESELIDVVELLDNAYWVPVGKIMGVRMIVSAMAALVAMRSLDQDEPEKCRDGFKAMVDEYYEEFRKVADAKKSADAAAGTDPVKDELGEKRADPAYRRDLF